MEAWFALLIVFVPPSVYAAFPPRTDKWRRARKWYWITLSLGIALFVLNCYLVDPAGPVLVFYGAWFVFVLVAAIWCFSIGTIRSEWSEWRERHRTESHPSTPEPEPQPTKATKPWMK